MNINELLRGLSADERFARLADFDPARMDYTMRIQRPDGTICVIRNPKEEADGTLTDKQHVIGDGTAVLAVGTAFFDWVNKIQLTIGIDIDTNDNHASGLDNASFERTLDAVRRVPWLEARRSTGGKGLHLFPKFAYPVDVASRAEGSALARAAITLASRVAGFDFKAVKDCAGGNMWVYRNDAAATPTKSLKKQLRH